MRVKGKSMSWNQYRTFTDTKFSAQSNLPAPAALTICKASLCQPLAVGVLCSCNSGTGLNGFVLLLVVSFCSDLYLLQRELSLVRGGLHCSGSKGINVHRLLLQVMLI